MKRLLALLACLSVGLALTGCGGSSSSGGVLSNSLLAGRWVGTFTNSKSQSGPFYLNIQTSGTVSGTGINTSTAAGNVPAASSLSGTMAADGQTAITIGSTAWQGPLNINTSSQLTGMLTDASNDTITVTVTPLLTVFNPFSGAMNGTFTNGTHTGTISVITDGNGNATGVVVDTTANTVHTFTGTIASNGSIGNVSFTQSDGATISGSLNVSGSSVTGSLPVVKAGVPQGTAVVTLTLS